MNDQRPTALDADPQDVGEALARGGLCAPAGLGDLYQPSRLSLLPTVSVSRDPIRFLRMPDPWTLADDPMHGYTPTPVPALAATITGARSIRAGLGRAARRIGDTAAVAVGFAHAVYPRPPDPDDDPWLDDFDD